MVELSLALTALAGVSYHCALGGWAVGVDIVFIAHSTSAPILWFRRRMKAVCDVLEGMKNHWFTTNDRVALRAR